MNIVRYLSACPISEAWRERVKEYEYLSQKEKGLRYYYTFAHVERMFTLFNTIKFSPTFSEGFKISFVLAVLYCNVYRSPKYTNPKRAVNKLRSYACYVRDYGEDGLLYDLILATRHLDEPPAQEIEAIIRDIDLAELGDGWKKFSQNVRNFRLECPNVSDDEFRTNCRKLFERLLARECIYHTLQCRLRFEARARKNLARAIAELS